MAELRASGQLPVGDESGEAFATLEICHNCRLLYPQESMKRCEFSSKKNGYPLPVPTYKDNYLTSLLQCTAC